VVPLPHHPREVAKSRLHLASLSSCCPAPVVGVSGRVGHRMADCKVVEDQEEEETCPSLGDASDVVRWATG